MQQYMRSIRYLAIFLLFAEYSFAGEIYTTFPTQIRADEAYVIYSHGLIVEVVLFDQEGFSCRYDPALPDLTSR